MACNLDEDIKFFLQKQKLKIKENIENTGIKQYFTQEDSGDVKAITEEKSVLNLDTNLFSQS
ncbi:hypothetical protein [uncultured Shewanella sp.]|uniref:hypothetical protein n=1 Tax=uncultured Shewanella sp. TaxID=173975 RepID=UPI00261074B7|nr:hypothetical protein [uncultured Shewanella sp.]